MARLLQRTINHYKTLIDDQRQCIVHFAIGGMIFLTGMVLILLADHTIAPSLKQELITLCGAILVGGGFFWAISSHICLMISRFKNF